MFKEALKKPC
jgi:CheY-like chemotaxis protein